ncbi:unnamed protein product [Orchesella dallaii]|uniref:Peptidase S8/S53 domain-containing protein n=1 Tax=Orchesella dallaii TaxID=48710 RepID=A0ABP1RR33_9HEXA
MVRMTSRLVFQVCLGTIIFSIGIFEASSKIDAGLVRTLIALGNQDVLVNFVGGNSRVINQIQSQSFRSREVKVRALTRELQTLTRNTQSPVKDLLNHQDIQYQSFWSSNQMVIRNAHLSLLRVVANFPQVSRIQKLPVVHLKPIKNKIVPNADAIQWGVTKIQADQVWSTFNTTGEGVVVANIDTGVRGTHEALAANFRSDHGWFDPYNGTAFPNDQNGHGTHTMGTIAGTKGIGVAPGSKWIACRGCDSSSCGGEQLLACGQWMLNPTNPDGNGTDPSKIPDVISNSWGSSVGGDTWYNATIDAWKAAGILSTFALGNQGPSCRTGGSPGDQPGVFSVGSTDKNDRLSYFSSRGPSASNSQLMKPEAGTIALMLSAYRNQQGDPTARLAFDKMVTTIEKSAVTQGLTLGFFSYRCALGFNSGFPNNEFGFETDMLIKIKCVD